VGKAKERCENTRSIRKLQRKSETENGTTVYPRKEWSKKKKRNQLFGGMGGKGGEFPLSKKEKKQEKGGNPAKEKWSGVGAAGCGLSGARREKGRTPQSAK